MLISEPEVGWFAGRKVAKLQSWPKFCELRSSRMFGRDSRIGDCELRSRELRARALNSLAELRNWPQQSENESESENQNDNDNESIRINGRSPISRPVESFEGLG